MVSKVLAEAKYYGGVVGSEIKDFGEKAIPSAILSYGIARYVGFHPVAVAAACGPAVELVHKVVGCALSALKGYGIGKIERVIGEKAFANAVQLIQRAAALTALMLVSGISARQMLIAYGISGCAFVIFNQVKALNVYFTGAITSTVTYQNTTKHWINRGVFVICSGGIAYAFGLNPVVAVAFATVKISLRVLSDQCLARLKPKDHRTLNNTDPVKRRYDLTTHLCSFADDVCSILFTRNAFGLTLQNVMPHLGVQVIAGYVSGFTVEFGDKIKQSIFPQKAQKEGVE